MAYNSSATGNTTRGYGTEDFVPDSLIADQFDTIQSGFMSLNSGAIGSPILTMMADKNSAVVDFIAKNTPPVLGRDLSHINNDGGYSSRNDIMQLAIRDLYLQQTGNLKESIATSSMVPGVKEAIDSFTKSIYMDEESLLIACSRTHVPGEIMPNESAVPMCRRDVAGDYIAPSRAFFGASTLAANDPDLLYRQGVIANAQNTMTALIAGLGYQANTLGTRKMSKAVLIRARQKAIGDTYFPVPISTVNISGVPATFKGLKTQRYGIIMSPTDFMHLMEDPQVIDMLKTPKMLDEYTMPPNINAEYQGMFCGLEIWVNNYLEHAAIRVGNGVYLGHSLLFGANAWAMVKRKTHFYTNQQPVGDVYTLTYGRNIAPCIFQNRAPNHLGGKAPLGLMSVFTQRAYGGGINLAEPA